MGGITTSPASLASLAAHAEAYAPAKRAAAPSPKTSLSEMPRQLRVVLVVGSGPDGTLSSTSAFEYFWGVLGILNYLGGTAPSSSQERSDPGR